MPIVVPHVDKPFPDYKWRWMEFTPVESFNRPDILLGVTRAIKACEGASASNKDFIDKLEIIQNDLLSDTAIQLVPLDISRNVLRRQGRYWRGLGLLDKQSTRSMKLTKFGIDYACGVITDDDFISTIINTHELPNKLIENQETINKWTAHNLKIKPLKLIIDILTEITEITDDENCYISPKELSAVIIPLAIYSQDKKFLAEAILDYRKFPEKYSNLPDCTPEANDKRMVREHLVILEYYGILSKSAGKPSGNQNERYRIGAIDLDIVKDIIHSDYSTDTSAQDITSTVLVHYAPQSIRTKKMVEVTSRPNQSKFRKALLANFGNRCLISGEIVGDVLIACHIHEVKDGGSDHSDNGVILRADLHILFDKNKLRISDEGEIIFSPDISENSQYLNLPKKVDLPLSVNRDFLRRRFQYGRVVLPSITDN